MRKRTGLLALLLTLLMLFSALAGCKKNDPDPGGESSSKSATTAKKSASTSKKSASADKTTSKDTTKSDSNENENVDPGDQSGSQTDNGEIDESGNDEEITPLPDEETIDLKGRKLVIASWHDEPSPESTGVNLARYNSFVYNSEKYNFTWQWNKYPKATCASEFINASLAGVFFCDLLTTTREFAFPEMVAGNMLLEIGKYVDFENDRVWKNKFIGDWKGKYYGFNWDEYYRGGSGIWYNRVMLEQEGCKEPYDYYMEGRWDWQALLELCLSVTRDLNGDGITDQIGLDYQRERDLFEAFVYSNGGDFFALDETNRVIFIGDQVQNRRAMQFLDEMFNLYKVLKIGKSQLFTTGKAAMFQWDVNWGELGKNAGMENNGWIMFPHGPDTDEYVFYKGAGNVFMAIPAAVSDPEITTKVLMDMYAVWDEEKPYYYGSEDMFRDLANMKLYDMRDKEFLEMSYMQDQRWNPMMAVTNISEIVTALQVNVFAPVVQNKGNVMNLLEAAKPMVQSILDDNDPTR